MKNTYRLTETISITKVTTNPREKNIKSNNQAFKQHIILCKGNIRGT